MRQMMTGVLAAIALAIAAAAPAMACGYGNPCAPIYAPSYSYGYAGCGACGGGWNGWGYEQLTDPTTQYHSVERAPQYYYADQGPTFTGPGAFAPNPSYQVYAPRPHYYRYGGYAPYHWRHHYSFRPHHSYRYGYHRAVRYGYHSGRPVPRRYY